MSAKVFQKTFTVAAAAVATLGEPARALFTDEKRGFKLDVDTDEEAAEIAKHLGKKVTLTLSLLPELKIVEDEAS